MNISSDKEELSGEPSPIFIGVEWVALTIAEF